MNNSEDDENRQEHIQQSNVNERLQNISRRGLNMVTGGAWNKARNTPILGAAAKRAENKVADKLGNTKLGQKLSKPNNHQKPNINGENQADLGSVTSPSDDIGTRNLQNSLANKAKNLWNQKRNNKKNNESSTSDNDSNNDENKTDFSFDSVEKAKTRIKRKIIISLVLILSFAFIIFSVFITVSAIITGGVSIIGPAALSKSYGTDEFESMVDEDSELYKDEINYYKKLKSVEEEEEDINIDYVNAILLSLYYQLEFSEDYENLQDSEGIDYKKMTENVDIFVELIKGTNSTDYSIDGPIYNALKNSNEFKDYYKEVLKNKDIDDVLKEVFELANELSSFDIVDETVITSETEVTISDKKEEKAKTKTISINDYISGTIYANTNNLSNIELIKAFTIVSSTNIVAQNKKLTINSNNAMATNSLCNIKEGCSYDKNGVLVSGPGNQSDKNIYFYNGGYYYKKPLTNIEQSELNKNINSVFGNVLVKSDGTYPTLELTKLNGFGEGDYKTILKEAYGDLKYKNVGENSYILDGSYGNKKVLTEVIFYDQKDYPNSRFCGIKGYTIGGSGCGVTAMAIVASTYENNRKYDPIYMNNEARIKGMCGTTGTAQAFFGKEATSMKYKYLGGTKYNKSLLNSVLKHLSEGHLVVVRVGAGHFTGGGHYMVLGGVDPDTKKVYVYDPNNKSNKGYRKTGNGWYSFNDIIVKEAYNFYIIWKG